MKCEFCGCWAYDEDLGHERCWADPNYPAPCEYEDDEDDCDDDSGFDPYLGEYTYDC